MGTTPKGIPYPEPTDFVKDGATAMQALAEAVDELVGGARGRANRNTAIATATGAGYTVNLALDSSFSTSEFTEDGDDLLYTGPDVVAVASATATFAPSGAGSRRLIIRLNGTTEAAAQLDPDGTDADKVNCSAIVELTSGDLLGLTTKQTSGGNLDLNQADLRVVVVGKMT